MSTDNIAKSAISPNQCRAARALLGWSMKRLSDESGVPVRTLLAFEGEERKPHDSTVQKIAVAITSAGVDTIGENGGGEGVRFSLPCSRKE